MRLSSRIPPIESSEPVGLVIADGGLGDHVPRFAAFVWGPVPEDEVPVSEHAAVRAAVPRASRDAGVDAAAVLVLSGSR